MVSVCLPSDTLLQHLPSYLGFSYLGRGVSLHGCSSKAQLLLLTLDEGYLPTAGRRHPTSEVRPGGAIPHPRPGVAAGRSYTTSKEWWLCGCRRAERSYSTFKVGAGAAVRRYPLSKVRSSGCALLEQL